MRSFFIWIWNFDFDNHYIKVFDWVAAFLTFVYGVYFQDVFITCLGILGFGCAWYRPVSRYQKWLKSFVVNR